MFFIKGAALCPGCVKPARLKLRADNLHSLVGFSAFVRRHIGVILRANRGGGAQQARGPLEA
jgi:hypothetical protein